MDRSLFIPRLFADLARRTWLVGLVTVFVCAAFAAQAVASMVEAQYLETVPRAAPLAWQPLVQSVPPPGPDGTAFVARNMFCSTCTVSSGLGGPDPTSSFVPDAILIATSLGSLPIATLRVPATELQGDFAVGDSLPGVGTITRIGFVTVDVRAADGRLGTLSLRPSSPGGRSDVGAATPDPAAAAPFADRIKKINDTTYEVDRNLVRELVSGSVGTSGTRIIPVTKDGKLDGLRLAGVKAASPAAALGLANGDVLQAINNAKIESANQLLGLYADMDKLETVELSALRKGKPLTLTLRLR